MTKKKMAMLKTVVGRPNLIVRRARANARERFAWWWPSAQKQETLARRLEREKMKRKVLHQG
jgi:hypothetical protein